MVSISLYIEEWPEAIWKKTLCSTIELIGFSFFLLLVMLKLIPLLTRKKNVLKMMTVMKITPAFLGLLSW